MTDLISRQGAIDALFEIMDRPNHAEFVYTDEIDKALKALPSAQTEIIRCEDCMHNGSFDTDCPIEWNGKEYCSFAERSE